MPRLECVGEAPAISSNQKVAPPKRDVHLIKLEDIFLALSIGRDRSVAIQDIDMNADLSSSGMSRVHSTKVTEPKAKNADRDLKSHAFASVRIRTTLRPFRSASSPYWSGVRCK